MEKGSKDGLWKRFARSLKNLKEEMEKESVARNVPPSQGCCHLPEEEIERKRAAYGALARERRERR